MRTVLVANRGEIALRVLATIRSVGLRGVAVFSDADAAAPHVRVADEARGLGPGASYLDVDAVVGAALAAGADALHPGYGYLSEEPALARACADAGVVFVGPSPDTLAAVGDKSAAKRTVAQAGVPVLGGADEDGGDDALVAQSGAVGFPLLVKAVAGGGGRGLRLVTDPAELPGALAAARREATAAFGSGGLLLERYVEGARHVEVQILADRHGRILAFAERECSLQRRYQKIVEESPAPWVDETLRTRLLDAAETAARACGYVGAGTVEFLFDPASGEFSFLEINPRLQVEHTVTEELYGIDLVAWQLRIAAGEALRLEPRPTGHAIEARICAEDPARDFLPTGGRVRALAWPDGARHGPGRVPSAAPVALRVDAGIVEGSVVGTQHDSLLAKVIAHAPDRATALQALRTALGSTAVLGCPTNVGFLRRLLDEPAVREGALDTGLVERRRDDLTDDRVDDHWLAAVALARLLDLRPAGPSSERFDVLDGWRVTGAAWARWRVRAGGRDEVVAVEGSPSQARVRIGAGPARPAGAAVDGRHLHVRLDGEARRYLRHGDWLAHGGTALAAEVGGELAAARTASARRLGGPLVAPMPGTVVAVEVRPGERVAAGQAVVVVEAMKMQQAVRAGVDGVVRRVAVEEGDRVGMAQVLAEIVPDGEEPPGAPTRPDPVVG